MDEIVIKNKRILQFYSQNPQISIESMNLLIIDLLEQINNGMNEHIISGINSQILSDVGSMRTEIDNLSKNVVKMNTDLTNNIIVKMQDVKKDYIEEYKNILTTNNSLNNERLGLILQQNTTQMIDKTNILLNDIIPKNNENIRDNLNNFKESLSESTNIVLESMNKDESLKNFIIEFEIKYNQLIQPLYTMISSSEDRINREICNIKNNLMSGSLLNELSDFFSKFKNSSYKGQLGENQLETILNNLFPSSEIFNNTSIRASCDFRINRYDYPSLLVETKQYDRNVTLDEVKKFIRDIEEQKCNGLFLSQNSGITSKQNFQIDMINSNIVIYVHNVQYDPSTIKMAVDVIDNLYEKLSYIDTLDEKDVAISEDILKDINREYSSFISKKLEFIEILKETNKKMLNHIEDIKFPSLSKFLSQKYGSILNDENGTILCNICNKFKASNNKSLAAHQRGCKKRFANQQEQIVVNTSDI